MKDVERYLQAGTRENTRRSYQSAVEHFEVTWGGFLPATSDSIVRYLVDYADTLSLNTLKQRLAALAQWHIRARLPRSHQDPDRTPGTEGNSHPAPEPDKAGRAAAITASGACG